MKTLTCPDCGTSTAFTPIYISETDVFSYEKGVEVTVRNSVVIRAEMPYHFQGRKYAILCCRSCGESDIALDTYRTDWSPVYPIPSGISDFWGYI